MPRDLEKLRQWRANWKANLSDEVRQNCLESARRWKRAHYEQEKERNRIRQAQRRMTRRDEMNAQKRAWDSDQRKTNLAYRIGANLSSRIAIALRPNRCRRAAKLTTLIGCSIEFLKTWVERQWKPGMSWENYGRAGWHMDHETPCSQFDFRDHAQQFACFHYTNVQPLWARENYRKNPARQTSLASK